MAGLPLDAPGRDYARDPAEGWRSLGSAVGRAPGELAADEAPWLAVAEAVNRGDHDRVGTRSELEALLIGVRGIRHPDCQRAAKRLRGMLPGTRRAPGRGDDPATGG